MRLIALLTLALLLPAASPAHPLHLSITNIVYENGKLNIQMKSFHGKPVDFTDPEQRKIPWFSEYLFSKFRITDGKEKPFLQLELDSVFVEEDAMTIEMHAEVPSNPNSLYIYNALLTDIYPDQSNLVIFVFEKKQTGIKFDMKKHNAEVILR